MAAPTVTSTRCPTCCIRAPCTNGVPADKVGVSSELSLDVARDGIVGRGVLLDIPRVEGRRWLEPGESVTGEALAAAETAQHVTVGPGDLLFVRVGHRPRRDHYGPWDAAQARAGLHPAAMQFLAEQVQGEGVVVDQQHG